jgi:hypothetical protein
LYVVHEKKATMAYTQYRFDDRLPSIKCTV